MSNYEPKRGYGGEPPRRATGELQDDVEGVARRSVAGPRREAGHDNSGDPDALYAVDSLGRAHRPRGVGEKGSPFLKDDQREQIDANSDMIKAGAVIRSEALRAYDDARAAGLSEQEADAAAQAVYDSHENISDVDQDVKDLESALESGAVTDSEAAKTIAELSGQKERLEGEVASLKSEIADLKQKIAELTTAIEGLASAKTDRELGSTTESGVEGQSGTDGNFTAKDQEALKKTLDEEDEGGADVTGKELVPVDRSERLNRIRGELADGELYQNYRTAFDEYTELKARSETRGWVGRKRREKALVEAETKMLDARIAFETAVMNVAAGRGIYAGNAEQYRSDDLFAALRGIDKDTRERVNFIHDRNRENRNWLTKSAAKIGQWFNRGGKFARFAKAGGSGLVAGFGVGFSGVGFPIGSAIGGALGLGVRGAAVVDNLDSIRATENRDAQGKAKTVMSDDEYRRLRQEADRDGGDGDKRARAAAAKMLEVMRKSGYDQADRARRRANATMGKFAMGYTAGMFAGNWVHDALSTTHASDGPETPKDEGGTPKDEGGGGGNPEKLEGQNFDVERGHGYNHELRDFAEANGQDLTARQADQLHEHLMDKFGKDYIDIEGVKKDIYMKGGDVRLSAPGSASWEQGVPEAIKEWMTSKGIWK